MQDAEREVRVAPLVGLLVLLGGGSSKTESRSSRGVPYLLRTNDGRRNEMSNPIYKRMSTWLSLELKA